MIASSRPSTILVRVLVGLPVGVLVLWLFDRALQPVPVAAGPAFLFGLAGLALAGPLALRWISSLTVAGGVAGILVHRHWHATGASPAPAEGLLQHLLVEGFAGWMAALVALAAALAACRLLRSGR